MFFLFFFSTETNICNDIAVCVRWNGSPNCKLNAVIAVVCPCVVYTFCWPLAFNAFYLLVYPRPPFTTCIIIYTCAVCCAYSYALLVQCTGIPLSFFLIFFGFCLVPPTSPLLFPFFFFAFVVIVVAVLCVFSQCWFFFSFYLWASCYKNALLCAPESNKMTAFSYNEN